MNSIEKNKIGIALSGGGSRGAFHVGFLEALQPIRSNVSVVSGTSIGSVVGAFYCANYPFDEMLKLFEKASIFSLLSFSRDNSKGLMRLDGLQKILNEAKIPKSFEQLDIPLKVIATDLNSNDFLCMDSGNLHEAVIASCSIPIAFRSVEINGKECVDGGLVNNLPADVLENEADKIIGIHINNYDIPKRSQSIREQADKVFSLVIAQNVNRNSKLCHYYINPKLSYISVLDFQHIIKFYNLGLSVGKQFLDNPKQFANRKESWIDRFIKKIISN